MKRIYLAITAVFVVVGIGVVASGVVSPYPVWFDNYLSNDPTLVVKNVGKGVKRTAHGKYKFSDHGGGTTGTAIPLGVTLPATAQVSRAYYYVTTQFTSGDEHGGTNSGQIGCGTGAHFKAALNLNAATAASFVEGIQTGTAATMTASSTSCAVSLSVASHSIDAGELDLYIEYVMPL